jgi:putative ABC transport system substrate-binding protein
VLARRALLGGLVAGALGVPAAVWAQEPVRRIGWLAPSSATSALSVTLSDAFRQGLAEHGWVEGRNIAIERRYADGRMERLDQLARELVGRGVEVLVTSGDAGVRAARAATRAIPIVMTVSGDPVGAGFVASLARPGGNVTGLSFVSPDLSGKLLALLKETVPSLSRVAVLWNAANPVKALDFRETQRAARVLGLVTHSIEVRGPKDLDGAFAAMGRARPDGLVTLTDEFINQPEHYEQIVRYAAAARLPSASAERRHVEAGGLLSYGPSLTALFRRAAAFVDKILKGTAPADLPVEEPTQFDLVINLRTARAIGVNVPPSVLVRADQVIQ